MSASQFIQQRIDHWTRRHCPFCGKIGDPWWLSILSTYSISCGECGEVIESFELYQNTNGHLYTENHELYRPEGPLHAP